MARKFYVVFEGRHPGVYEDWDDALDQVKEFPGAKYKGFASQQEAVDAFRRYSEQGDVPLGDVLMESSRKTAGKVDYVLIPEIDLTGWAVDASCLGNPGVMEYRGVELATGAEIFRVGPFQDATNNIGEFLAIVHALALQYQKGVSHPIYSDSRTGMAWVRNKRINTKLAPTARNARVFELMRRALEWLHTHSYSTPIRKWETDEWGEIPADFNRK